MMRCDEVLYVSYVVGIFLTVLNQNEICPTFSGKLQEKIS